ncbi:hypothetical protein ZWY2020_015209 [Hordeum vulgare]|nr:hypothetical protein ZWY2020_015209 [Hordeum vulgare]
MADPATLQLLPDLVLEEIFVRLPPNDFHRCRCVSRAWAATLSSDDVIDRHLSLRGKIRLDYDDIMSGLLLDCCIHDCDDYADRLASDISREKESDVAAATEETTDEVGDGDGKTVSDWREEYRTRGYVEVDKDYYTRREEMEALLAREWANMDSIKAEIDVADSDDDHDEIGVAYSKSDSGDDEINIVDSKSDCDDDEIDVGDSKSDSNDNDEGETGSESDRVDYGANLMEACTIPYGALHPRIRLPFLEEDPSLDCTGGKDDMKPIRGREKTEEEVDQEIIAFLRRMRDMDPQPQFLREFDTYRWPWPIPQQGQDDIGAFDDGEDDEESDAVNL